ncbi:hypothetical protein C2845_PM17G11210 [Panicum miliaceum]|uniref:Uncharacterized protein n=1 Tax=Panicum miliaceum TaxID=4540 RepID=A0A3L6Q5J0_PANMI|nr:hypothetical protein C2845_PM17G11210 [Panicum miliaceum]
MEEAGSENPWRQFPGCSAPYLRVRAAPTPSTGEITWSSDGTKRLADRVIKLKDHESGVREHDILSTAIDTPEHRGCVHGVSSSKGWKEAFSKENECLWKKKKRSFVDPDRLKQEIMDENNGSEGQGGTQGTSKYVDFSSPQVCNGQANADNGGAGQCRGEYQGTPQALHFPCHAPRGSANRG